MCCYTGTRSIDLADGLNYGTDCAACQAPLAAPPGSAYRSRNTEALRHGTNYGASGGPPSIGKTLVAKKRQMPPLHTPPAHAPPPLRPRTHAHAGPYAPDPAPFARARTYAPTHARTARQRPPRHPHGPAPTGRHARPCAHGCAYARARAPLRASACLRAHAPTHAPALGAHAWAHGGIRARSSRSCSLAIANQI